MGGGAGQDTEGGLSACSYVSRAMPSPVSHFGSIGKDVTHHRVVRLLLRVTHFAFHQAVLTDRSSGRLQGRGRTVLSFQLTRR